MADGQRPDYHDRVRRAQAVMADHGMDALAIGVGSDLLYLAAYPAHTSERLTLLIVPKEGEPKIVVPQLEASHLTDDAWVDFTQTKIAGLTERQAAERLMGLMRDHGMESVAFCIAASGPNSASPHYSTADRVIREGDAIVFDFGGYYRHYV